MKNFFTIKSKAGNYIIELSVSKDRLQAYIRICTDEDIDEEFQEKIKEEDLLKLLEENKVNYGIDIEQIKRIVDDEILNVDIKIAQGKPKSDGENSHAKLHFDINPDRMPKIDEKGRMDFKELGNINNVKKEQILAEKTLPTEGQDGIDVYGMPIKSNSGKNIEFKYGKNVKLSENGLKLISEADGKVEFSEGRISVNNVMNINGDIDTATGNIRFNGDVEIRGDVKTGFLLQAEGNVHVYGVIEGATVKAKGTIVVEGGIQGNDKAEVFAEKGIICRYIENSKDIKSEGDITTDFIIHSNIHCKGSMNLMGRKSMIVGGTAFVRKNIDTGFLGSVMGTKTDINVGIDDNMRIKLQAYYDEREFVIKNIKSLGESIQAFKKAASSSDMDPEKKKLIQKSVNTYNGLVEKLKILDLEIKNLQNQIAHLSDGFVNVRNTVYPGVKITMGNSIKYIRNETEPCRIVLENNEIALKNL